MRVLFMLAMLAGCTHRTSIRHAGSEIGEQGVVKLRTGEKRNVSLVGYVPTGIVVNDGYQVWQVPYQNLETLEYESHAGGAWSGFKWGAAIGGAFGALWGLGLSSEEDSDNTAGWAVGGAFIFALTGIVIGVPIGAIKGETTVYTMD